MNDFTKEKNFDTYNTIEIICPYCGHEYSDSWEFNDYSGCRVKCYKCGNQFELVVDFNVTYTTYRNDIDE